MKIYQSNNKFTAYISWFVSLVAIILSTFILYLSLWDHGVKISPDSSIYLNTGYNFAQGQGLGMEIYRPATGMIEYIPTTHYPPLLSMIYAAGLSIGLNWEDVPTVLSLLSWISFLVGIGTLTYSLGKSFVTMALIIVMTTITPHFWLVFQHAWSEVLFLPLLVWLMIVLVDLLPSRCRQQEQLWRLGVASLLLVLIMLTRYVGIFVLAAVLLWWIWWHLRDLPQLIKGSLILACSALPLAAWLIRNMFQPEATLGGHLSASIHTATEGLVAVAYESASILIPSTTLFSIERNFGLIITALLIAILIFIVFFIFWRYVPAKRSLILEPHNTPIFIFIALYLLLYTVAQPFLSFYPMDMRDMTAILCLSLPVLGALLAWLPATWWSYLFLHGYVAFNMAFAFAPVLIYGKPEWIVFNPPAFRDITVTRDRPERRESSLLAHLIITPPRTKSLVNNHAAMLSWLKSFDRQIVVLTNEGQSRLFASSSFVTTTHPWISQSSALNEVSCRSETVTALVIFDWYGYEAGDFPLRFEQRCPDVLKMYFEHSIVYLLHP